ncbi:MAG: RibD family protein [Gloeomargaritaceae cyanobacterium C42_A2020_066]|nr:RibD family protein [Gloeomargaritaceae cyanobacterium C42_A2020_066]
MTESPWQPSAGRPTVRVVLAISLDGRLSPATATAGRFGSAQDRKHLETQIAWADATLLGANTLRAYQTSLAIRDAHLVAERQRAGRPAQPQQWVCSQSGNLDPTWRFFQQPFPRGLLTSPRGAQRWPAGAGFEDVWVSETEPWDWDTILSQWHQRGAHRLLVLGGGQVVGALLAAGRVDDLYLTLCPVILGHGGPRLAAGLPHLQQLQLVETQIWPQEVLLHYRPSGQGG